jgi:hypothetical protein
MTPHSPSSSSHQSVNHQGTKIDQDRPTDFIKIKKLKKGLLTVSHFLARGTTSDRWSFKTMESKLTTVKKNDVDVVP